MGSHASYKSSQRRLASIQTKQRQPRANAVGAPTHYKLAVATARDTTLRKHFQATVNHPGSVRVRQNETAADNQVQNQPIQHRQRRGIEEHPRKVDTQKSHRARQSVQRRLQLFLSQQDMASKLIWVLDDALYKGSSPSQGHQGITVLLPKTAQPPCWKDTRPIALSNTIDRTMAQLLQHTNSRAQSSKQANCSLP